MTRVFRVAVLFGILGCVGLVFPSVADAQRGGGGRAGGAVARGGAVRGGGAVVRGGGAVVRGGGAVVRGGVYGGQTAVPRRYPPYSSPYYRPYYSHGHYPRPYYYRPYYAGYYPYYSRYYPYYYAPWAFSLSFGWYGGGWYPPAVAYPYYYYPYPSAYPASPDPSASQPPFTGTVSPGTPDNLQREDRAASVRGNEAGDFGTLSIRVMPADATIVIDREVWDRPRGDDRFSIELVEGPHHIEVRKAGYATYVRTIDVPRGRSVVLNVALTPSGSGTLQVARTVPFRQ